MISLKEKITAEVYKDLIRELTEIPDKVSSILVKHPHIKIVAAKYKEASNALYLGRGCLFKFTGGPEFMNHLED